MANFYFLELTFSGEVCDARQELFFSQEKAEYGLLVILEIVTYLDRRLYILSYHFYLGYWFFLWLSFNVQYKLLSDLYGFCPHLLLGELMYGALRFAHL
jgi:hypothetical protein